VVVTREKVVCLGVLTVGQVIGENLMW
jgi:hypothetical protein